MTDEATSVPAASGGNHAVAGSGTLVVLPAHVVGYLHAQGITDPATWAAFRLEQIDAATQARFRFGGKRLLRASHGISIPSFDPRDPTTITGIIRQNYAQNVHRFVTPPLGIAGPIDLVDQPRIVLTTNPLTALRLHQAGVAGVALVEDPVVLAPLLAWLAVRTCIIAAHKQADAQALRMALGTLGSAAPVALLSMSGSWSASVRTLLGIAMAPASPPPLPSASVLADLHRYAQDRLAAGEGQEALDLYGASIPELVRTYRIGYLPATYRTGLSRTALRMLAGTRCGNALVLPAFDADRQIVDLLVVRAHATSRMSDGMWPEPRGLLAPEILHGRSTLTVTNAVVDLVRLAAAGYRDVLLLRGPADVVHNSARLRAAGVQAVIIRARRSVGPFAAALRATGFTVTMGERIPAAAGPAAVHVAVPTPSAAPSVGAADTPPPSPAVAVPAPDAPQPPAAVPVPMLAFVDVERDGEVGIWDAGPVRYAITLRDDGITQRRVVIRANGTSCTHDLDLAVPAQRERISGGIARRIGVPASTVLAHLAALHSTVQAHEAAAAQTSAVPVVAADRPAAEAFLAAPDLLDRVAADLTALGWVGEEATKHLLYLTAISRLLPQPVWSVYHASAGTAPWQGIGCIAALTPPEDRVVIHRLTDAALAQTDSASLRHRLLLVDQAETLRPETALALRVLHERGGVGWSAVAGVDVPAAHRLTEHRGPVAVLAAAVGALDPRCRDCFLPVRVDDSPAQTARILAEQRRRMVTTSAPATAHAAIIARHHAAQRLLDRRPVVIPFVDRIVFPASRLRHRAEQAWLLGLIAASALLHQRQRQREDEAIVASEADAAHAMRCSAGLLGRDGDGIGAAAERLLHALIARQTEHFTMAVIGAWFPDWSRFTYRAALQDLLDFGYLESPRGGRGRLREFQVVTRAPVARGGIWLRPADVPHLTDDASGIRDRGELAAVGETGAANVNRVRTGT